MKKIPSFAVILYAAAPFVSAAPTIRVSSPTYIGAFAASGEDRSFTENNLVPFEHTVTDAASDHTGFDFSATASAGLQISLAGSVLSGTSNGAVSVTGDAIPGGTTFSYVASFEFLISIPLEDPSYTITFTGATSTSGGAQSYLSMQEIGSFTSPLFHYGVNSLGASAPGGNFVGVLEPGKSYTFLGLHSAVNGGGSVQTSGFNFNLQMTPKPPAPSQLEAVLPMLPGGELESPMLKLPAGLPPRFSFRRLDSSLATHVLTAEWSTNLADPNAWNPILIPVSSEGDITIIERGSDPDKVLVSIPAAANKPHAFCRLKVEEKAAP